MDRFIGLALTMLVFGLAAGCTSDPEVAEEESAPVLPVLFDSRTAVLPAGTDWGDGWGGIDEESFSPNNAMVTAVLATIDTEPDLVWGAGHVRFISGSTRNGGEEVIYAYLSCDASRLLSPENAMEVFRNALGVDGGGSCYGNATFTSTGELIAWRTNGES